MDICGDDYCVPKRSKEKNIGRKISILMSSVPFLVFLGLLQRENLQIEEVVFYLAAGVLSRVIIHYIIAKILGPFIWGRGFCGWACWTAAVLEWLPIKENRPIPRKYTYIRIPVLIVSLAIPVLFILTGYDYVNNHILRAEYEFHFLLVTGGKFHPLMWFLAGNFIYYAMAIPLAFIFKKKRAFCKIVCPVSLVMKAQTALAVIKQKPSGKECTECGQCNEVCPMDVDVMKYIKAGKRVSSTECILCGLCRDICPVGAIR